MAVGTVGQRLFVQAALLSEFGSMSYICSWILDIQLPHLNHGIVDDLPYGYWAAPG